MSRLRKMALENDANINTESLNKVKSLISQLSDELEMLAYSMEKMHKDYNDIGDYDDINGAIKELKEIAFHAVDDSEKIEKDVYPILNKWLNEVVIKSQQE